MKRRLLNLLTLSSMLAGVAAAVLWVAGVARREVVGLPDRSHGEARLLVGGGRLTFFCVTVGGVDPFLGRVLKGSVQPGPGRWPWRSGGFALVWRRPLTVTGGAAAARVGEWTMISVPFWALLALSGLLPSLMYARVRAGRRRTRRPSRGLCPSCGYDLCATPARCPECGTEADYAPSPLGGEFFPPQRSSDDAASRRGRC